MTIGLVVDQWLDRQAMQGWKDDMAIVYAILEVTHMVLSLYLWILFASIILSWLTNFGIINSYQPFVQAVGRFLYAVTEPALQPIRRFVPSLGGIDISPMILILVIYFFQSLIRNIFVHGF